MAKGLDCATRLNSTSAANLRAAGYEYAARYLGLPSNWKTFDAAEAAAIIGAGLKLISIFEKNSTYPAYFTRAQGVADANEAMQYAKAVGQPTGTAIYFTVDFNAGPPNYPAICEYMDGVNATLQGYDAGLYGSFGVMNAVRGKAKYLWQTYAWSAGQTAAGINMKQYKNNVTDAGIQIDQNEIYAEVGAWNEQGKVAAAVAPTAPVTEAAPITSNGVYTVQPGDTLSGIAAKVGSTVGQLAAWNGIADVNKIYAGQQIKTSGPAANSNNDGYLHIVASGETLSGIAAKYGMSVNDIAALNGISNPNLIYAGQRLRLKGQAVAAAPAAEYYTVVKGDVLSRIAANHGTTVNNIVSLNHLANPNLIYPGQKLRIK